MLPDLLVPLADQAFNLFRYITFRTGGATITALIISLLCGPAFIAGSKRIRLKVSLSVTMVQNLTFK